MEKFIKLNYSEVETKRVNDFESSFAIQPLERGFANTLGNAIRRTLLSSVTGVAPFAIRISGVDHEFQTIPGVMEDVVQIVLNLKTLRIKYNPEVFQDGEILKISLNAQKGKVTAKEFQTTPGVEIVSNDHYIATTSKANALEVELFLRAGRGFVPFSKNKDFIKEVEAKMESKLKSGTIIAIDSEFSPIENVSYEATELNSASAIIQEKMQINVKTDGSVEAKDAIAQAAAILGQHLEMFKQLGASEDEIFKTDSADGGDSSAVKSLSISSLDLSVRSYNCLKRAGYEYVKQLVGLNKKELESIKNLGKKSVEEIIAKLNEHEVIVEES